MIVASAILFYENERPDYPVIMTGLRHCDVLERIFQLHISYNKNTAVQGFIDEHGKFYDRFDAKYEAQKCGQLIVDDGNRALYSEDIWPE